MRRRIAYDPRIDRPACDCGHAFERDPRWFHLGRCAYRESWRLPDGTQFRFGTGSYFARSTIPLYGGPPSWGAALHAAERRQLTARRRYSRVPALRTAYACTRRARRHR